MHYLLLNSRSTALHGATAVEDGLSYMKSHEWARADGDTITVGISDFAQVGD